MNDGKTINENVLSYIGKSLSVHFKYNLKTQRCPYPAL